MIELFPQGFEECPGGDALELSAYTDEDGRRLLESALGPALAQTVGGGWESRWREFHRGARVGGLWIGPPWEEAPAGLEAIVIDPGQAFGTGAHPTTRLCLELLCDLPRTSLLDVGSGSGVLAIAAAKLGFSPVHAVDADRLAVDATAANAAANGVALGVTCADALADVLPRAGTTVANLTLPAVRGLAPRIPSTALVTAGYLVEDPIDLPGWRRSLRRELEGWAADVWARA